MGKCLDLSSPAQHSCSSRPRDFGYLGAPGPLCVVNGGLILPSGVEGIRSTTLDAMAKRVLHCNKGHSIVGKRSDVNLRKGSY